jgi:hypothetical protein
MQRAYVAALLAGITVLACDRSPTATPSDPSLAIVDGFNDPSRSSFFFLFPIRPLRNTPPAVGFNPNLAPVIEVCEWTGTACRLPLVSRLTMKTGALLDRIFVLPHFKEYAALWRTQGLNLRDDKIYRIRVLVGAKELGFADIDVVKTLRQAAQVDDDEFVPLLKDFILPIRFWIGEGALCDPGTTACASTTVALAEGGTVVLAGTFDRVRIPAQPNDPRTITLTIQYCDDIDVDLPRFGPCLRVTADPPLGEQPLVRRAVVSLCSVPLGELGVPHEQEHLITLHRQDGELLTALPHAPEECPAGIGAVAGPPRNLVDAGWRFLRTSLATVLGRHTVARRAMLDVGGGGETDFFSDFQFALPAHIEALEGTLDQTALAGTAVPVPPGVRVTDRHGDPVHGATVHFALVNELGTIEPATVVSNADGIAQVASWVLGEGAPNTARAFGRGLAAGESGPFMPDITVPTAQQVAVQVGSGEVTFDATATLPLGFRLDQLNDPETGTSFGCGELGASLFQGFTPGLEPLAAVDLRLRVGGSFPAAGVTSTIKIRSGFAGYSMGSATALIAGPRAVGEEVVVRFVFATPIVVPAGSPYLIEWLSPAAAGVPAGTILTWMGRDDDPYNGGNAYGCDRGAIGLRDMNFATYAPAEP